MTTKPALKRELGLRDLTLFAVTCIISARWIPIAAHAGPGSVTLWFLAAVLFMVPLTVAVVCFYLLSLLIFSVLSIYLVQSEAALHNVTEDGFGSF